MAINTVNPYPLIGTQLAAGMDAVSAALSPTPTIDDLVIAIYNFVQPIYYPALAPATVPTQIEIEIKSVVYNIINAYNNNSPLIWNPQQINLIRMMLGSVTTDKTPVNALNTWILDLEDNITKANMTLDQQTPLLLGTMAGKAIYAYWVAKVATPGTWAPFFQTPAPLNYANIPLWTAACMEGALIGANATQKGLIAPSTDIVSVNIISSLIGALTIGAGKVIFKWVPRIQPIAHMINIMTLPNGCTIPFTPGNGGIVAMVSGGHQTNQMTKDPTTGKDVINDPSMDPDPIAVPTNLPVPQ